MLSQTVDTETKWKVAPGAAQPFADLASCPFFCLIVSQTTRLHERRILWKILSYLGSRGSWSRRSLPFTDAGRTGAIFVVVHQFHWDTWTRSFLPGVLGNSKGFRSL